MRLILAAACVVTSLVCFRAGFHWPAVVCDQTVLAYREPSIPVEFQRDITYFSMVTKQDETVDGPTSYQENYVGGWSECGEYFLDDVQFENQTLWDAQADNATAPWNLIHAPPHVIDAYYDGWRECERQIHALLKTRTPDELRADLAISQRLYVWTMYVAGVALLVGSLVLMRGSFRAVFCTIGKPVNWVNRFLCNRRALYVERIMLDRILESASDEPSDARNDRPPRYNND